MTDGKHPSIAIAAHLCHVRFQLANFAYFTLVKLPGLSCKPVQSPAQSLAGNGIVSLLARNQGGQRRATGGHKIFVAVDPVELRKDFSGLGKASDGTAWGGCVREGAWFVSINRRQSHLLCH